MNNIMKFTVALATSFEFLLTTSLLALFASAYPDSFRTALWRDGGNRGWNSDPRNRVYLYANYQEIPPMPMIWDERSTQYNLCIAIITMVLWFVRLCIQGRTLDVYGAVMSNALYDVILIAFWSYSAVIQSSGDFSDPSHISFRPWYLDRGCNEAWPGNCRACQIAKASYGLAICAIIWFGVRCFATCMYGAFMYGRQFEDTECFRYDEEKSFDCV